MKSTRGGRNWIKSNAADWQRKDNPIQKVKPAVDLMPNSLDEERRAIKAKLAEIRSFISSKAGTK